MLREAAKSIVLKCQTYFNLFPRATCLISGAPRSGTTALINWLGEQPGVSAFEESRILVSIHAFMEEAHRFANLSNDTGIVPLARRLVLEYYASSRIVIGMRLIVDKEPLEPVAFPAKEYGQFLRNIRTLLPEAQFLLAVRDPIATIWSMSRRTWGESLTNPEANRWSVEQHTQNWCSCADLILHYASDPRTHIVQFGRLVNDPRNESRSICHFLGIRAGKSFEPHPTKDSGFSREEREEILRVVQPRLEMLKAKGISDL